eukprot:gnl/MRDRNA2_/MRDRNA2_66306_c0_seq1.p1 gnl/MRDRNA2_/MRDRNA2_66306_c0~~gnl/MRDRNA2_/MRDRNA2_66306_c0_seq1.p1  ORF type:complete len:211 (-),score=28.97 gnl/MRDRNA2_/MRDRNA2_66306_c0_seq1:72-704(-)
MPWFDAIARATDFLVPVPCAGRHRGTYHAEPLFQPMYRESAHYVQEHANHAQADGSGGVIGGDGKLHPGGGFRARGLRHPDQFHWHYWSNEEQSVPPCWDLEDCKDWCRTEYADYPADMSHCERQIEIQFPITQLVQSMQEAVVGVALNVRNYISILGGSTRACPGGWMFVGELSTPTPLERRLPKDVGGDSYGYSPNAADEALQGAWPR